jgi:alpha-N-arabinofuranosidase
MRLRIALFAAAAFCLGCTVTAAAQQSGPAVPDRLMVTINTQQTAEPVSKYEFGMFIEHLRTLIYRSLWSEMLDDRKFYFPISSTEPDSPAPPAGSPPRGMPLRKWRPVGPDEFVVMDKDNPFVGDQSPRIKLDSATPHGNAIVRCGQPTRTGPETVVLMTVQGFPGHIFES